jgi:3-hydroxypropanoate dehydrogenase
MWSPWCFAFLHSDDAVTVNPSEVVIGELLANANVCGEMVSSCVPRCPTQPEVNGKKLMYAIDPQAQNVLFREARTANTFSSDPVSDEQIQAIYELAKWGPTSMNTQPLRVVLVRSNDAKAKLMNRLVDGNKPKAQQAPLVAIIAADLSFHDRLEETFPIFPGAKDLYADDTYRTQFAIGQTWLQAGYFIMGVRALGLAAGPMLGIDAAGIDADLLSGTNLRTVMVVNIGKPGENAWFDRLPRLSYESVTTVL